MGESLTRDREREKSLRLELQQRMEEHSLLESDLVPFEEASMLIPIPIAC
jgi:hypothetical protein